MMECLVAEMVNNLHEKVTDRVTSLLEEYGVKNYVFAFDIEKGDNVDVATFLKTEQYGDAIVLASYLLRTIISRYKCGVKEIFEDLAHCFSKLIYQEEE